MVDEWGEVMGAAGRERVRARALALGDGSARAYLLPEERRLVIEAASPMETCSFLVRSFRRVKGLRTDACASGLGASMGWMLRGSRWIALCARIAADDGN